MDYLDLQRKILIEDTRATLLNASRSTGDYKDQSLGKNRYMRRQYSQIKKDPKTYSKLNMDQFFKQDILELKIPVQGETDSYIVSVKLHGACAELARRIKVNKNIFEFKVVLQALKRIFDTTDIYINCTCKDYYYTYKHWNIVKNVDTEDSRKDPGPGKRIRNPQDEKGRGCKHCLLVLENTNWLVEAAKVINDYIRNVENKLTAAFLSILFPKLYGCPAEQMVEKNLIDTDKYLENSSGLIDAINAYSKQGKQKTEQPEETIEEPEEPEESDDEVAEAAEDTNE